MLQARSELVTSVTRKGLVNIARMLDAIKLTWAVVRNLANNPLGDRLGVATEISARSLLHGAHCLRIDVGIPARVRLASNGNSLDITVALDSRNKEREEHGSKREERERSNHDCVERTTGVKTEERGGSRERGDRRRDRRLQGPADDRWRRIRSTEWWLRRHRGALSLFI